ncbi:hypothetical protein EYF80_038350 [Liparis tanakae]|uniref:Uncharacterized protein n=1 Tax=Liparis tanakae TaxID=230148 RepID=A0A4Z2GD13_9TELE|nr:hypothetical protein EYF80_038350 [Liparis tanakae]
MLLSGRPPTIEIRDITNTRDRKQTERRDNGGWDAARRSLGRYGRRRPAGRGMSGEGEEDGIRQDGHQRGVRGQRVVLTAERPGVTRGEGSTPGGVMSVKRRQREEERTRWEAAL